MVITLIGYRGSGKTSVARPLAERLGWDVVDADVEIERRAGKSIRQIFADDGEPRFRRWEHDVLADLLSRDRLVIAAGGGAILNGQTRRRMREAGPVVWLQAEADVLERRILGDATTAARRPKLSVAGGRAEIEQLLAQREPLYRECADVAIDTGRRSVAEIVDQVLADVNVQEDCA